MKDKGNQKRLIPGIIPGDTNIEIFSDKTTRTAYFIQNGRTRVIDKLPQEIKTKLYTMLANDPIAREDLKDFKFHEALNEYVICMFGKLDNTPDIINGEIQLAEESCEPGCRCQKWQSKITGIDKYGLTHKEKEVLRYLVNGKADKAIATKLNISPNTVSTHKMRVFKKLNVHSKRELQILSANF
ncbi:helix-turn-helix transcriptional regulator [Myroides marinus]|uniref:helix-turn-helix domain-containing protein n=1 Tax=Myroides marinus TaxID=703342 RepID=UPI002577C15D|nr:helix-turn-helix transcriptional regulator [Myroides marinus]MDM1502293.1 helix-turn-helix transcriptional regulator [Myroides marinus]